MNSFLSSVSKSCSILGSTHSTGKWQLNRSTNRNWRFKFDFPNTFVCFEGEMETNMFSGATEESGNNTLIGSLASTPLQQISFVARWGVYGHLSTCCCNTVRWKLPQPRRGVASGSLAPKEPWYDPFVEFYILVTLNIYYELWKINSKDSDSTGIRKVAIYRHLIGRLWRSFSYFVKSWVSIDRRHNTKHHFGRDFLIV